MSSVGHHSSSKQRSCGFETLETRCALDGTGLGQATLPAVQLPAAALRGVSVYAVPIGPAPATPVAQANATPNSTSAPGSSILQPIPTAYLQQLNIGFLPIGPARPPLLPSQQSETVPPSTNAPSPLYVGGVLPTNPTPANLPTEQQTMPVNPNPPDVPNFKLVPGRPIS